MFLILARHGNTFTTGQTPYQVGRYQDLELVDSGRQQASKLAEHFKQSNLNPDHIYSAPLKRTKEFAKIIADYFGGLETISDPRLTELDYGHWAGLTEAEILNQFGTQEYQAWQRNGTWPMNAGWQTNETDVIGGIKTLVAELINLHANKKILLVSSNGILRYFLDLVPNLRATYADENKLKIATGAYSIFEFKNSSWQLIEWNKRPD